MYLSSIHLSHHIMHAEMQQYYACDGYQSSFTGKEQVPQCVSFLLR
jgi:hypothetical protein